MTTRLRVLSYNIHKGFNSTNLKFILSKLKESIESVHADIVLLQEVVGHNEKHRTKIQEWPTGSQFEYLADRLWPHFAYGKNAVYTHGHHGNAILSKYPILMWENVDVSTNRLERRGLLHIAVDLPESKIPLHVICLHLGLFESGRMVQIRQLCDRIKSMVPAASPLIVGGDFNDWTERASSILLDELQLQEIFVQLTGKHAKTFPSWLPSLKLDRIYHRLLEPVGAHAFSQGVWNELSDHVALMGEYKMSHHELNMGQLRPSRDTK
jgi:endonuclease/exonuclease/phosphatase family metal-dependent hydrolase